MSRCRTFSSMSGSLKQFATASGADLVGIADLAPFKAVHFSLPGDFLEPYTYAVSVAVRLDDRIINAISDHPTPEYAEHYRSINRVLDDIAAGLVEWIAEQGFKATAVAASSIVDDQNLWGSVSHKAIARMAGIGWQGKSLLIITPQFGPRVRLTTVLTDMELEADGPIKNRCGTCTECTKACPAWAIRNVATEGRYAAREDALYFSRCAEKTAEFKELPGIGARICGVCVKVCPHGKARNKKSRS